MTERTVADDVQEAIRMSELPWNEKVPAISIHPDMASRDDVAKLAVDLMDARHELYMSRELTKWTLACMKDDKTSLKVELEKHLLKLEKLF